MASIISVDTLQDSAGSNEITTANVKTAFDNSARAWCCYNGTGTAAITESFNFSSITDSNTGTHSVTFTSNMSSGTYSTVGSTGESNTGGIVRISGTNTSLVAVNTRVCSSAGLYDDAKVRLTITGDLA